ncbi:MAG TPA: ABC transporter permease subunit, partial [Dehalococcoidia bacterium]|nr:ABC transporter permease subunit [Dehalococcoidia bacterium]
LKAQALSIMVKPYIEAARVAGGSRRHIIFVHIVPNLLPLSLLYMMFTVTAAIFSEAVLSYFGILNVRMSWGIMIHTASSSGYLLGGTKFWWLILPAGGAITLLCSAFYLVGRALDEVVNPRLRRQYGR